MRPLVLLSSLAEGGAERVAVALLAELRRQGRPVSACTLTSRLDAGPARRLAEAGVERLDLRARRLVDPAAAWRYVATLRRERFDLVHAHGQDAAIVAAARRAFGGPRLVVTRHVLDEPRGTRRERWRRRLALAALRRADAVVAVSAATARRLSEVGGPPQDAVHVVPNGIELDRFDTAEARSAGGAIRSGLGIAAGEVLVACVAVLREGKGHEALIDATLRARSAGRAFRLLVVGDGPTRARLQERAAPSSDAVVFVGARADVPELLSACDAVALASESEALPTALIEAAAARRPVIATDVGGTSEVVSDGVTGLLVPAGDAVALDAAIGRLVADGGLRRQLGEAARRRAESLFSIESMASRTWALWEAIAGRRR